MPDFMVTGKKGGGKTLSMIDLIYNHVQQGRVIATNLDLNLEHLFTPGRKECQIIRVPDLPKSTDLELIGCGNPSRNEEMNGALILDELAISMNSRNYQDKDRQALINWLVLARKLGWDVYYLVQDISMIDKQVREGLAEHVVYCRRLDRAHIPIIGTIFKFFFGVPLRMPRLHIATVKYGTGPNAPLADRWSYRGDKYFKAYDTRQRFKHDYPHGTFSYLPPYILTYRSFAQRTGDFYVRLTKIIFRKYSRVNAFGFGIITCLLLILGVVYSTMDPLPVQAIAEPAQVQKVTESEKQLFEDLKIVSYSALPGRAPIFYLQNKNGKITNKDLEKRGFKMSVTSLDSIAFSKGDYHASVYNF